MNLENLRKSEEKESKLLSFHKLRQFALMIETHMNVVNIRDILENRRKENEKHNQNL